MATDAYRRWVNAGRPWRKAKPIADIERWARGAGVRVLGTIGNLAHLKSNRPQDHTPYSFTAWPDPLPDYVVTAIDLAPSDATGDAILASARNGAYPWLKYMNWHGRHYSIHDSFKHGAPNPDQHVHLSIRSDHTYTSVNFDPSGDDDMPSSREIFDAVWHTDEIAAPSTWGDADNEKLMPATFLRSIRDQVVKHRIEAAAERGAMLGMLQKLVEASGGKVTKSTLTKAAEDGARAALADVEFGWTTPEDTQESPA